VQDDAGFAVFYERHRSWLHRAVTATIGDPQLAAEAADEALVRAAERWEQVSTMKRPEGWLYRVAVNWATSWRRKWSRRPTLPIEALERSESDRHVYELVDEVGRLPLLQRQTLVLRFVLGSAQGSVDAGCAGHAA
jgi:DNA-directed RNA polymerase specialized sigma24 family protein